MDISGGVSRMLTWCQDRVATYRAGREGETWERPVVEGIIVAQTAEETEPGAAPAPVRAFNRGKQVSRLREGASFLAGAAIGNRYVTSGASLVPNLMARARLMKVFWNGALPEIHSTFMDSILGRRELGNYVYAHLFLQWRYDRPLLQDGSPVWYDVHNTSLTDAGFKVISWDQMHHNPFAPYYDMAGIGAEMAVNGSVAGLGLLAIRNKYKSVGASLLGFSLASHMASWAQFFFQPNSGVLSSEWMSRNWDYMAAYPWERHIMSGVGSPDNLVRFMTNWLPISSKTAVNTLFFGHLLVPIAAVAMLARVVIPKEEVEGQEDVEMSLTDKLRVSAAVATSFVQAIKRANVLNAAQKLGFACRLLSTVSVLSQALTCYQDCAETRSALQDENRSQVRKGLSVAKSALSLAMLASFTSLLCIQGPLVSIMLTSGLAHMAISSADAYFSGQEMEKNYNAEQAVGE